MKITVVLVALMIGIVSCNNINCSKEIGVQLDHHLFAHINIDDNSYCDIAINAMKGDQQAIASLSKIDVHDGASYQHGAVLIEVIDKISEEKYLQVVNSFDKKEKMLIFYSVWAGLDFTSNTKYKRKRIEVVFPELSKNLKPE